MKLWASAAEAVAGRPGRAHERGGAQLGGARRANAQKADASTIHPARTVGNSANLRERHGQIEAIRSRLRETPPRVRKALRRRNAPHRPGSRGALGRALRRSDHLDLACPRPDVPGSTPSAGGAHSRRAVHRGRLRAVGAADADASPDKECCRLRVFVSQLLLPKPASAVTSAVASERPPLGGGPGSTGRAPAVRRRKPEPNVIRHAVRDVLTAVRVRQSGVIAGPIQTTELRLVPREEPPEAFRRVHRVTPDCRAHCGMRSPVSWTLAAEPALD